MSDIMNTLLAFTSKAFVFLIAEFLEWSILVHDKAGWHFRFGSADDYPNLRPLISTFKAAVVLFILGLIISPFILSDLDKYLTVLIGSSKDWWLLFALSVSFSFLWLWHHIAGKDWNTPQHLLAVLSVVFLIAYLYANLG